MASDFVVDESRADAGAGAAGHGGGAGGGGDGGDREVMEIGACASQRGAVLQQKQGFHRLNSHPHEPPAGLALRPTDRSPKPRARRELPMLVTLLLLLLLMWTRAVVEVELL